MVFDAVEVLQVGSKPPAAVIMRISKGERHDLGAAAPFSTTTSSLQGRAGGSAFMPKLVEVVFEPAWTLFAEKLSPLGEWSHCPRDSLAFLPWHLRVTLTSRTLLR